MDGWDDLQFYILFNSNLAISGRWGYDNERLSAMEPCLPSKSSSPQAGLDPGTARSVGQYLTYRATGATSKSVITHNQQYLLYPAIANFVKVHDGNTYMESNFVTFIAPPPTPLLTALKKPKLHGVLAILGAIGLIGSTLEGKRNRQPKCSIPLAVQSHEVHKKIAPFNKLYSFGVINILRSFCSSFFSCRLCPREPFISLLPLKKVTFSLN